MARVARQIDQEKIGHLKEQIQDPSYLEGAVDRLAGRITERLLGLDGQTELAVQRSDSDSRNDIARVLTDDE